MTPTHTQVARWQPQHLNGVAHAIDGARCTLADIARSLHRDVSLMRDHDHWVSDAQAAAEQRAEFESRRMLRCADRVADIAEAYRSAFGSLESTRLHLLGTVAAAQAAGAIVGDDWQVVAGTLAEAVDLDYWKWTVGNAVTGLTDADTHAARMVCEALAELTALVPDTIGTSGIEARELAVRITDGAALSPAEIDRVYRDLRGIQPSADQLAALARGEQIVVPQSTLDYMQELYGALGVDGFADLSEQLARHGAGDGQRLLANGLALAAGPHMVGAAESGTGGLPPGIAEFFDSPATAARVTGNPPVFYTGIPDAGLLDRFAQAYGAGDAVLQQDNLINRALLDRAGLFAGIDPGPHSFIELEDAGSATFDGLLGHLVEAGGRDQGSVHDMVVDADVREDRILPLLQHDWSEFGEQSVTRMFDWIAPDAIVAGDDPAAVERATRAGETAFGLSRLLSERSDVVLDVPGAEGKSIGELNPVVTQGLAAAVAPYLADMVGVPESDTGTQGYGALGFENAPALYAVLSSDVEAAGHLTAQASTSVASLQQLWATSDSAGIAYAEWSGRLVGVVESGLGAEFENRRDDEADASDRRGVVFDTAKAALYGTASIVPLVGPLLAAGIDTASPSVRDAHLSTTDQIGSVTVNASTDVSRAATYYNMALGIEAANGGQLPADSKWDPYRTDGNRMRTLTEIASHRPDTFLSEFGSDANIAINNSGRPLSDFFSAFEAARASVPR